MSTAVLISGQLREFARCYPTQRWHVYRRHPACEFYIVVQRQPDADVLLAPLRRDFPGRVHVELIDDPTLEIPACVPEAYHWAPFANAAPASRLLLQHWYQQRVWDFYRANSTKLADVIIRQRCDNLFHTYIPPKTIGDGVVFTPWWGTFGGVNDRFAVMHGRAGLYYFNVYPKIEDMVKEGCPFHPETLLATSISSSQSRIVPNLNALFSTARPKGHPQHPQRFPEILPWEKPPGDCPYGAELIPTICSPAN